MLANSDIVIVVGWILTAVGLLVVWFTSRRQVPHIDMQTLRDATEIVENYNKEIKAMHEEALIKETRYNIEILNLNDNLDKVNKIVKDQAGLIAHFNTRMNDEKSKYDLEIFALKKKIEGLEAIVKSQDDTIDGMKLELIKEKQARQRLEKVVIRFQEWAIRNKDDIEKARLEPLPSELFI
jgi:hypothetical protein